MLNDDDMEDEALDPVVMPTMMDFNIYDQDENLQMSFVAGHPIYAWLASSRRLDNIQEKIVSDLVHLWISIYKLYGPYSRQKVFQTVLPLMDHLDPHIGRHVVVEFLKYLYRFVVSQYGHLPPTKTYTGETMQFIMTFKSGQLFVFRYA
ncbi:hypothetical protein BWQ96_08362 [Gracilariopsis chorda]|uniref:Uncharacterized protein n=1 Tax=Gracilariopsis chorda TaxID=448386 RepID=A0A2V3IL99_9FLOR|nr:hypothetical protein BWQ96_08362 [Gracilariopsis chorda]|eukprot:PXF41910.1 hypothetical protein BWQ96_08362 [Gracilariopsis chorda]